MLLIILCAIVPAGIGLLFIVAALSDPPDRSDALACVLGLLLLASAAIGAGVSIGMHQRLAAQVEAGR